MTFPNGTHICEVEIDPETGVVDVVGYTAVDDVGNVFDETVVEGPDPRRGGAGARTGARRMGDLRFGDGQLVTGSFMDYLMPQVDDFPDPDWASLGSRDDQPHRV